MQTQEPLQAAMQELQRMPKIDIKGKQYATVSSRVEAFRKHFPVATIETVLIHDDESRVIIQAKIQIGDTLIATGFAEEFRGDGWINATSALENAETSAIGRGLSAAGLMGGEYASSFEVNNAVTQQQHLQNNTKPKNIQQRQSAPSNIPSYQNHSTEQRISQLGLSLEPLPDGSISVTGNSYPHAQELRKIGCAWKPELKRWILPVTPQQKAA